MLFLKCRHAYTYLPCVLVLNPDSNLVESILHFCDDFIAFCGRGTCLNSISDSLLKCLHKEIVSVPVRIFMYVFECGGAHVSASLILVGRIEIYIRRAAFYLNYYASGKKPFPGNIYFLVTIMEGFILGNRFTIGRRKTRLDLKLG